jgi:hypothetical protein
MNRLPINNTNLKQALGIDNSLYNCFHVFFLFTYSLQLCFFLILFLLFFSKSGIVSRFIKLD